MNQKVEKVYLIGDWGDTPDAMQIVSVWTDLERALSAVRSIYDRDPVDCWLNPTYQPSHRPIPDKSCFGFSICQQTAAFCPDREVFGLTI